MVHKKLMQARMFLQQMALKKSGHNKFSNYYYFELGDFLPQINEIFHGQGLCGVISYDTDYASLTITDVDDGTNIVITSPMVEANLKGAHAIQNLGAVETYQRRYLWMTAMEIVEHDALDSSASATSGIGSVTGCDTFPNRSTISCAVAPPLACMVAYHSSCGLPAACDSRRYCTALRSNSFAVSMVLVVISFPFVDRRRKTT